MKHIEAIIQRQMRMTPECDNDGLLRFGENGRRGSESKAAQKHCQNRTTADECAGKKPLDGD